MKDTWDNLFFELDGFATDMGKFFPMIPKSPALQKEVSKLSRRWKKIQKLVNKFEQEFYPAKPINIRIPEEFNHDDFIEAWKDWKEYLAEQHQVVMGTRMEAKGLTRLLELSEGNKQEAIKMLDYASSTGYSKFFKVNKNSFNNQNLKKDGPTEDPDFQN